jgi:hypothetical protein
MKRNLAVLGGLVVAVVVYLFSSWTPPRPESPPPASAQQAPPQQAPPAPQDAAPPASLPGTLPSSAGEGKWSDTRPAVNLEHIFEGEVNRRGKPVGFHSRPGGKNPSNARVVQVIDRPNQAGVYTADVEIRNKSGRWLRKRSTFYPDRLSREEVVAAVLHAWNHREKGRNNPFRGPSGEGFDIEGRPLDGGDINTAYPLFDPGE